MFGNLIYLYKEWIFLFFELSSKYRISFSISMSNKQIMFVLVVRGQSISDLNHELQS